MNWVRIFQNQNPTSMIFGALIYTATLAVGVYYGKTYFALAFIALHIYLSIETVEPNQWGAILFLRSAFQQVENTPVYVFFPFFQIVREPRTVSQIVIGTPLTDRNDTVITVASDEYVHRIEEPFRVTMPAIEDIIKRSATYVDPFPPELALPIVDDRMVATFKGKPLHRELTIEPQLVAWFDIRDFLDFLKVIPDTKTLSRNIASIAKATLQEAAGQLTVGMLIAYNQLIAARIRYRIEQLIGEPGAQQFLSTPNANWGVNFREIQIASIGLSHDVNKAMRDASAAQYNKDTTIADAEGSKRKLILEGEGAADARKKLLLAEADGARELANATNTQGGTIVLQLQALKEFAKAGNTTLIPASLQDLGALLVAGRNIINPPRP